MRHYIRVPSFVYVKDNQYYVTDIRNLCELLSGEDNEVFSAAEVEELRNDLVEIDALESQYWEKGIFSNAIPHNDPITLPDGSLTDSDTITGFTLTVEDESQDPPGHLFHPAYDKWIARIKASPHCVWYGDAIWSN